MTLKFERIPVIGRMYTKNATRFPDSAQWGDITKGLPVAKSACDGVFASHVLEHLSLSDFHNALENTRLIIKPGGIFRMIVPDLEVAARNYVRSLDEGNSDANSYFLRATHLGAERRHRGISGLIYGWLNTTNHLWMWDAHALEAALLKHGFSSVRRSYFGDSEDRMFDRVEDPTRFEDAVAMEARA